MKPKIKSISIFDYFITFLLIANSGLPFFTNNPYFWIPFSTLFVFIGIYNNKKVYMININFFRKTMIFLFIIILGQVYVFEFFDSKTTITLFVRWSYPFLTVLYLGTKFHKLYIKILYFLSLISLTFFILIVLVPGFYEILLGISELFKQQSKSTFYRYTPNLLIYSLNISGGIFNIYRNPGPFWEPGGFGVYLNLAFILNTIYKKKLINKYNIVFILAIVSTLSTAALLVFFVFIFLYQLIVSNKIKNAILYAPIIILLAYYLFTSNQIFKTKIEKQITTLEDVKEINSMRRNRMVSALIDLYDFKKSPIFGLGRNVYTRFGRTKMTYFEHRNNGLTDFLLKYGFPFFIFYFYYIYISLEKICLIHKSNHRIALISLFTIMLVGFSQTIFQHSIFIALFFYNSIIVNKSNNGSLAVDKNIDI